MRPRSNVLATALAAILVLSSPLHAQSVLWGSISGTVTNAAGQGIARVLVTLSPTNTTGRVEVTSDLSGSFAFGLVGPGTYELRAEAVGYRPLVARTVTLTGGEGEQVSLMLTEAQPPVVSVDTVRLGEGLASRWHPGGVHFGEGDFGDLPDRFADLASVASLSTMSDRSLGSEGLPGSATVLVADGVPVYRARHPLARAEDLADPAFPRSALSGVTVYHASPDIEWYGSAGGYLAAATRSGLEGDGTRLEGSWSGDPLWSSSRLDFSAPSLTSFRGAAGASGTLSPGRAYILFAAEGQQEEAPLAPRIDTAMASSLTGLDADLINSLSSPSIERVSRYSALVRADVEQSATSRFFVSSAAAYSKREFDGPGPVTLGRDAALPEESIDLSLAGGLISELQPETDLEIRAGVTGSDRKFDVGDEEGMPTAYLAGSGTPLGMQLGGPAEASRFDFFVTPLVHHRLTRGTLKGGLSARLTRHSGSGGTTDETLYSDAGALLAGQGFARAFTTPDVSYSTQEVGAFAQYELEPAPRVRVSVGARYDHVWIPRSDIALNDDWYLTSGLRNDSIPSSFDALGGRMALTWDPSSDGLTRLTAALSVDNGELDPSVLSEVLARNDQATNTEYEGGGLTWPGSSIPASATALPTLTILGPDVRAPRSVGASFGVSQTLGGGWSVHVDGSYRRTDFLMRRRNLNLPVAPQAVDAYGRDVYGTLQQDGSLVTATGSDARRFPAFGEVRALDPDGWSEYQGVTFSLEHSASDHWVYAAYTRSKTTDNWVGASRGSPDAELLPLLPGSSDWSDATSDFDVPNRATAAASASIGFATVSAAYHYRSGLPFTPRYRAGVDANGDGSIRNDVAFVDASTVDPLLSDWACLKDQVGGFAVRNSCRAPAGQSVDVRLRLGLGRIGGHEASLVVDGFNLIESKDGLVDDALVLVDPAGSIATSADGSTVTVPVSVNPDFGRVLYPSSRGRIVRIGLRLGGPS